MKGILRVTVGSVLDQSPASRRMGNKSLAAGATVIAFALAGRLMGVL